MNIMKSEEIKLSIKQYLTIIIPYLAELINERKNNNNNEYKIQLSMDVNFMCITDKEKTRTFYVKSDNNEIRLGNGTSNIINELIKFFLSNYQKEVLLMIANNEQEDTKKKWHYIALKSEITDDEYKKPLSSLSRLFRGITSNNNGDFCCLGCLHSFRTDNKLKDHERLCNNHDYCGIAMPAEDKNILKYNLGEKSLKEANIIYLDLESLLIKQQSSQNNPEKSYTEKKLFMKPVVIQ